MASMGSRSFPSTDARFPTKRPDVGGLRVYADGT